MSEPIFQVVDLTATQGPRRHEIVQDGRSHVYVFESADQPVAMPRAHALTLVGNAGFAVHEPSGQRLHTRPAAAGPLVLRPDEVVARLEELTVDALLARAQALAGGGRFKRAGARRDDLIAFLIAGLAAAGGAVDAEEALEVDVEDAP